MRAIHIISGLSPSAGGPSYSVPRLCEALKATGCETLLMSIAAEDAAPKPDAMALPQDHARIPGLSRLRMSKALRGKLEDAAGSADILHNHGLWLMPNIYAGHAATKTGTPLVVSPRGMLAKAALKFSPLRKKIFWAVLQNRAFDRAAAWHATSAEEAEEIRDFGIKAPIAIIPNGIDIPEYTARHPDLASRRTLLFMSRLHPKKGLNGLIETWSRLEQERPDWDLVLAGPDEGRYRAGLEAQAARLGCQRVTFTGPVYGQDKADLLTQSDLFVLPTQNENFGLVVGEALAARIPAIVTKGAPWQGLETEGCGFWIDHGVEPMLAALQTATSMPACSRKEMGARGRAWMARDFSWDAVAQQMIALYSWVCGREERPSFVC